MTLKKERSKNYTIKSGTNKMELVNPIGSRDNKLSGKMKRK